MPANGELAGVKLSKSNAGEYNKKFKRLEACQDNSKEIKGWPGELQPHSNPA